MPSVGWLSAPVHCILSMTGLVLYVIVSLSPTCIYGALFRSLQLPATALLAYLALNTVCELHLLCFF